MTDMTDKTSTAEREAADCFNTWFMSLPERRQDVFRKDMWLFAYAAYQAGRASLPLPGAQEAVGYLWQHCETGRTRVVLPDQVVTADACWIVVGPLFLGAAPQPALSAGWVSVDERLPEPNVEVLCAGRGWGNSFVTACYYDEERREWYPINTHWTDATGCAQYPTHWQPLPVAPPMDGESNG